MTNYFFHNFSRGKPFTFYAVFSSNSETVYRCRSEKYDSVPVVTSSVEDSELIIHFQETYAKFFSVCCTEEAEYSVKLVFFKNHTPGLNQETVCVKVYPEVFNLLRQIIVD